MRIIKEKLYGDLLLLERTATLSMTTGLIIRLRVKEEKYGSLPPVFVLYIPHSHNNFVKHAKPLKSPARDLGSCAALEPGRCKGREDLCNSGLVLPRVHTHTKRALGTERIVSTLKHT